MSARTKARRRALDVLFEADQKGVGADADAIRGLAAQRATRMVAQTTLPPYAATIVAGVSANLDQIDAAIIEVAHGWSLGRMPAVDRAALRVGVWEIRYNDEVEAAVTINEIVTIVADLSTDKSPSFVNGVLDAVARGTHGTPVTEGAQGAQSTEGTEDAHGTPVTEGTQDSPDRFPADAPEPSGAVGEAPERG